MLASITAARTDLAKQHATLQQETDRKLCAGLSGFQAVDSSLRICCRLTSKVSVDMPGLCVVAPVALSASGSSCMLMPTSATAAVALQLAAAGLIMLADGNAGVEEAEPEDIGFASADFVVVGASRLNALPESAAETNPDGCITRRAAARVLKISDMIAERFGFGLKLGKMMEKVLMSVNVVCVVENLSIKEDKACQSHEDVPGSPCHVHACRAMVVLSYSTHCNTIEKFKGGKLYSIACESGCTWVLYAVVVQRNDGRNVLCTLSTIAPSTPVNTTYVFLL